MYKLNGIEITHIPGGFDCRIHQNGSDITYHVKDAKFRPRAKALLMDLDGTSVKSEEFWVWLIERTVQEISGNKHFAFGEEDIPFVSGYTTIRHLSYCIEKYGLKKDVYEANAVYHRLANFELDEIMQGRGNISAFKPREGLKEFLLEVKAAGIQIGLVTSGLDYKAIPEIVSVFRTLDMGDPLAFYDAIITGGKRKIFGQYGTLGELAAKPHPWIYAEIGAALAGDDKERVVALEDSSSGVISARTAGYAVIGFKDGNLLQSGTDALCYATADGFAEVLKTIV